MKKNIPVELPHAVTVRLSEGDFDRLVTLARAGRRNVSQTLRILLEGPLRETPHTS